jgi:hypothetical protein
VPFGHAPVVEIAFGLVFSRQRIIGVVAPRCWS